MTDLAEPTNPASNTNTILLSVTLAVLLSMGGAVGWACMQLSALNASMIGRPEFESKLAEIRLKQSTLETEIFQLRLDLADGKYRSNKPGSGSLAQ